MDGVAWGNEVAGVRFGIRVAGRESEAGGSILLDLACENRGREPIDVFGFRDAYPRSLRVSPPKQQRPWIRVSFGDVNFLHPPEAFTRILPGGTLHTSLDLSFAFDRRGVGRWPIAFAYEPVRAGGRLVAWAPPEGVEAQTAIIALDVVGSRSLREAGVDEALEAELDYALVTGDPDFPDRLRRIGLGGALFAARRVARVLSPSAESTAGWRALATLATLGPIGRRALQTTRDELPHAESALTFAADVLARRAGDPPHAHDLPFITMLDRVIDEPAMRGNFLLSWTACDSPVHGLRRLEVLGNGETLTTVREPGEDGTTTRRSRLGAPGFEALLHALRAGAPWMLRPVRPVGMPDEPRPTLEIELALGDPFARRITMWNGEWRQGPGATFADVLDRIGYETFTARHSGSSFPPPV